MPTDDYTAAYPSHKTIAKKAGGISPRTVRDCLRRLQDGGYIEREGWSPLHTISYRIETDPAERARLADLAKSRRDPAASRRATRQAAADKPSLNPSEEPSSFPPCSPPRERGGSQSLKKLKPMEMIG
jgi:hypothetical protein